MDARVYFTSRPLYLRKRIPVPIEKEGEWAPQPVRKFAEKKKNVPAAGIRSPDRPAQQQEF